MGQVKRFSNQRIYDFDILLILKYYVYFQTIIFNLT
jgi:hypothetical protein